MFGNTCSSHFSHTKNFSLVFLKLCFVFYMCVFFCFQNSDLGWKTSGITCGATSAHIANRRAQGDVADSVASSGHGSPEVYAVQRGRGEYTTNVVIYVDSALYLDLLYTFYFLFFVAAALLELFELHSRERLLRCGGQSLSLFR